MKQPSSWMSWKGLWRWPSPFLKFFTKGNWGQSRDSKWLLRFDTGTGLCVFKVLSRHTIPIWLPTHSLKIVLVVTMESSSERLSCSGSHKQNLNSSVSHPRTLLYTSRLGMTNVFHFKRQVRLRGMLPRATILRSQATSSFCRKVCDWLAIVPLMQDGEQQASTIPGTQGYSKTIFLGSLSKTFSASLCRFWSQYFYSSFLNVAKHYGNFAKHSQVGGQPLLERKWTHIWLF